MLLESLLATNMYLPLGSKMIEQLKEELNTLHQEFEKMAKEAEKNTFIVSHAGSRV